MLFIIRGQNLCLIIFDKNDIIQYLFNEWILFSAMTINYNIMGLHYFHAIRPVQTGKAEYSIGWKDNSTSKTGEKKLLTLNYF